MNTAKLLATVTAASLLVSSVAFAQTTIDFSDVPDDHKAKVAIDYMVGQGFLKGFDDGTFKPEKAVSRVEGLKIIIDSLKLKIPNQKGQFTLHEGDSIKIGDDVITIKGDDTTVTYNKSIKLPAPEEDELLDFTDVDKASWYAPVIQRSVRLDLVQGHDDGTFKPHDQFSLAGILTLLSRAAQINQPDLDIDLDRLPDYLDKDAWYAPGIAFGLQEKLIGIEEGKRLAPFYELNRGEAVIIIYNYVVLSQQDGETTEEVATTTETTEEPEATPETDSSADTGVSDPAEETTAEGEFSDLTETGIASYYGKSFDGANTASGEKLDTDAFQAAHKTLPFNTVIKVTNTDTGRWVKARVIDRGPFVEGRIVDLTPAAFEAIAELSSGLANVRLEVESQP